DLVDADLARGLDEELVPELRRLVDEEPLRERRWAQLVLALYRAGRQGEALAAYQQARQTLVDELGIEPGPDLKELQERVLAQDPTLEHPGRARPPLPVALDPVEPLLVGRDAQLAALRDAWEASRRGRGSVLVVAGEPGSGRTRLAAELAATAHGGGALVLHSSAVPESTDRLRVLRRAVELLRLDSVDDVESTPSDAAVGLAQRLVLRASDQGTLVVLDDLEALDGEERRAVATFGRTLAEAGILTLLLDRSASRWEGNCDGHVQLGPLQAHDAVAVAALYVGEEHAALAAADVAPVPMLPGALHAAASAWHRQRIAEEVDVVSRQVQERRQALDESRADLTSGLAELSALEEAPRFRLVDRDRCPYMGLRSFDVADADLFFGRDELTATLVALVVERPLVAIVGPSGSGKSSLARAGMLAALRAGRLPGSERWQQAVIRPGTTPVATLNRALDDATGEVGHRLVLVDQLEELFADAIAAEERAAFAGLLVRLALDEGTTVIVTLRADHVGDLAGLPELSALVQDGAVLVGPMAPEELRRAIELPALRMGLRLEQGLSSMLVAEVAGRAGALPLLSTALLELWERRQDGRLSLAAHRATGGVAGAVARLAEATFERLDEQGRQAARRMLLRMCGSDGPEQPLRRRVPLEELTDEGDLGRAVLALFAERRLVTLSDASAEVAHEALLSEWPRLRGWLDDDTHGRLLHRHLTEAARRWDDEGRNADGLYRGARLASALTWAEEHGADLNRLEAAFLRESERLADSERREAEEAARQARAASRRLRRLLAIVATVLVFAVVTAGFAMQQRSQAADRARVADAGRLGSQALAENALDLSLLLAVQARELDDSPVTRGTLLAALARAPQAIGVFRAQEPRFLDGDLSPDGSLVAAIASDGPATVWDTATHQVVARLEAATNGWGVAFSPDGESLAIAGWSADDDGVIELYETSGFERVWSTRTPIGGHRLDWAPDGSALTGMGFDGLPRLIDAETGSVRTLEPGVADRDAWGSTFLADSRSIAASWEGLTLLLDAQTGNELARLPIGGPLAVSRDGRILAVAEWGAADRAVVLVDVSSGEVLRRLVRHTAEIQDLAFAPDGRELLSAGDDALVVRWDVTAGEVIEVLEGHGGRVWGLGVTSDGETASSASLDGSVIAWDLSGLRRLGVTSSPSDAGIGASVSPDGRWVVAAAGSGVAIHDRASREERLVDTHLAALQSSVFIDNETAVLGLSDGSLRRLDIASGRVSSGLDLGVGVPGIIVATPEGSHVLVGTDAGEIVTVEAAEWRIESRLSFGQPVWSIAFDHAGKRMAVALDDGSIVVAGRSGDVLATVSGGDGAMIVVAFDPTGRYVLGGGFSGVLQRWKAADGQPVGEPLKLGAGWIIAGKLHGELFVAGSTDGMARLVDVRAWQQIGTPLPVGDQVWVMPTVLPDGRILALTDTGPAMVYEIDADRWTQRACAIAGRTLTEQEWRSHVGDRPWTPGCGTSVARNMEG
ncbi:MAG: BTAD domain-containing putative transcriptional regulator, partial [Nitriliruptorales bacterium]|nr:BTAD domain-containing putative transcriptional regulator [Nitriliruptorales bacterium]